MDLMVAIKAGSLGSIGSTSTAACHVYQHCVRQLRFECAYRWPVPWAYECVCGAILGCGNLRLGFEDRIDTAD